MEMPVVRKIFCSALILALALAANLPAQATAKTSSVPARPVWPDETGPLKWAPRPTVPAITANDLRTRLYQIADDSMMGRRVGELGNYKATEYIAREFRRLGLKPAGENGTYFQELPYGPTSFDVAATRLMVDNTALEARRDFVPIVPTAGNGVAAKANLVNAPTVFAGRFGDSATALDPATFRGKVAVFLTAPAPGRVEAEPIPACPADQGWPNQRGAAYALAQQRASAAGAGGRGGRGARGGGRGGSASADPRVAALGAAGVLLIESELTPASANAAFVGRGSMRPTGSSLIGASGLPAASISATAAARIFDRDVNGLQVGASGRPVSAEWSYEWRMSHTPARNVIAILPGRDPARAGEYVLVSAHNDHNEILSAAVDHDSLRAYNTIMRPQGANDVTTCRPNERQQFLIDSLIRRARGIRPPRRDSIMNGADDDGSGTVVLLEIAEKFATEHPSRSIIFVSHTGEEAGLLGSAWFTGHPTIPLDSVVAAHNMDMLGKGRVTDVALGGPNSVQTLGARRLASQFGDIIDSVNALSGEPMTIDRTWDVTANPLNRFCRSDQVNYVHHNVPVTYFSLGYARDYHQPTDEPQYIDYEHAARLGRWIHDIMTAIANRKDRPLIDGPDASYPACR